MGMKEFGIAFIVAGFILVFLGTWVYIPAILFGCVLAALGIAMALSYAKAKGSSRQFEAKQLAAGYKYAIMANDGSAIAISPQHKLLLLRNARFQEKQYPFESVRGWNIKFQQSGRVHGAGSLAAIGVANATNRTNRLMDAQANGLYIEVKDIDLPVWRVAIQMEAQQQRWHEILTQCINEGAV
ncbi:MAG TPA: DUF4755 domain-containing protein [Burkholderiales bacterium]|nr:DUF4755 domain-containing protein [Burkholderiales bacterium]